MLGALVLSAGSFYNSQVVAVIERKEGESQAEHSLHVTEGLFHHNLH